MTNTVNVTLPRNTLINLECVLKSYLELTFNLPSEEEISKFDMTIEEQDQLQEDLEIDLVCTMVNLLLAGFPTQNKEVWARVISIADSLNLKDSIGLDKFSKFKSIVEKM